MKNRKTIALVAAGFAAGLISGRFLLPQAGGEAHEDEHHHEEGAIEIQAGKLAGVKTARVSLARFDQEIAVTGQVAKDVDKVAHVAAGVDGVVETCPVRMGSVVESGEILCTIRRADGEGITEIKAPFSGLVVGSSVRVGSRVDSVTSLHSVEDLSRLSVVFDVYEKDVGKVAVGQGVRVTSPAFPDRVFPGRVSFVSPRVDEHSRSVKVRGTVENPEYLLKLGMFVSAGIVVTASEEYIILPREAVCLVRGKGHVFVRSRKGIFKPRPVVVFGESGGKVAVSSGLALGEEVAVGGVFLLKSELLRSEMGEGCAD